MQGNLLKKKLILSDLQLEYELLYNEGYGIRISVYRDNMCVDRAEIHNICVSALEIQRIFMVLSKYAVTPVTVYDVLDVYFDDPDRFS